MPAPRSHLPLAALRSSCGRWTGIGGGETPGRYTGAPRCQAHQRGQTSVYLKRSASGAQHLRGASVASPFIASVYALAGNAGSVNYGSYSYSHTSSLNDVTSGQTANCGSTLCTAAAGWDGPTGNGTPNGVGGF